MPSCRRMKRMGRSAEKCSGFSPHHAGPGSASEPEWFGQRFHRSRLHHRASLHWARDSCSACNRRAARVYPCTHYPKVARLGRMESRGGGRHGRDGACGDRCVGLHDRLANYATRRGAAKIREQSPIQGARVPRDAPRIRRRGESFRDPAGLAGRDCKVCPASSGHPRRAD
jgi:hypothetical protein